MINSVVEYSLMERQEDDFQLQSLKWNLFWYM